MIARPPRRLARQREQWLPVASVAAALLLWELFARTGVLRASFFPPPSTLVANFLGLLRGGSLLQHLTVTLGRLVAAFLLAALPAVPVGLAMGISRPVQGALDPLIMILYPIPSLAFMPMVMLVAGIGEASLLITAAVTPFFLIAINTAAGVAHLDRALLEAGENYGATGWKRFLKVIIPGTLPHMFTGFRLGLGIALIVVIAVEMIAAKTGLGALVWLSWQIFRVEDMYCGLAVIGALGVLVTYGLQGLGDRLMPWQHDLLRQKGAA